MSGWSVRAFLLPPSLLLARSRSVHFQDAETDLIPPPLAEQLKDIIQDLYQIMVQVSSYDSAGRSSKEVLSNEVYALSTFT